MWKDDFGLMGIDGRGWMCVWITVGGHYECGWMSKLRWMSVNGYGLTWEGGGCLSEKKQLKFHKTKVMVWSMNLLDFCNLSEILRITLLSGEEQRRWLLSRE